MYKQKIKTLIVNHRKDGISYGQIGKIYGIPKSSVHHIVEKAKVGHRYKRASSLSYRGHRISKFSCKIEMSQQTCAMMQLGESCYTLPALVFTRSTSTRWDQVCTSIINFSICVLKNAISLKRGNISDWSMGNNSDKIGHP